MTASYPVLDQSIYKALFEEVYMPPIGFIAGFADPENAAKVIG
jgi:hypothetical protein